MNDSLPSLLVLEDDNFTRLSLISTLVAEGFEVVHDSSDSALAIAAANILLPQVAVIDLHLGPGPTGIDVARGLRATHPHIGIVILTSYDDPRLLGVDTQFIPAGTQYVVKGHVDRVDVLTKAITASQDSRRLLTGPALKSHSGHLSDAQIEILTLVAEGLSNQEISRVRGVSVKAIEATIQRIAAKLSMHKSRSENQRVHMARAYFRAAGMKTGDG